MHEKLSDNGIRGLGLGGSVVRRTGLWQAAAAGILVFAAVPAASAQQAQPVQFSGQINDFTPADTATGGGPWEAHGTWSLQLIGTSGKANFSAALTMERSDEGVTLNGGDFNDPGARHGHTHHVMLVGGDVTPLSNGFRVTGLATVTGNGNAPPDFSQDSHLQIDVVGGTLVTYSNIKLSFLDPSGNVFTCNCAAGHFGTQPLNGVVESTN